MDSIGCLPMELNSLKAPTCLRSAFLRDLADEFAVEVVKELVGLLAAQVYEELCSALDRHCFLGGLSFAFGFLDFVEQSAHVVLTTRCRVLIGHKQRVIGKLVH